MEEQAVKETLDVQEEISQEISKFIINFKKDSSERKSSPNYYENRLTILDDAWNRFTTNDLKIPQKYRTTLYMKFYNDCRESYDKYRAIIRDGMEQSTSQAEEENYLSAWGILVDSYNNPRHVADTILNRFLHQNTVSDDPRSLKELYIITIESLASLKGLGIDVSSWDTILIAIIKQKLDLASRALYEQSLDGSRELQGLDTLLSFLDQRIRVLGTGKKGQQSRKEQKGPTCSSASTGKGPCCQFCKRNHWLYKCDDFRSKTIPERVNWVQKHRLCVNCFSNDHKAKDCRGRPCFKCDKKHHTLLHLETTSGASSNQHSPTVGAASNKNYNLLATVKVSVKASNGQVATFRALLYSGSQINLISERMASVLSLKLHGTSLRIEGIGGNPKTSRARASVQIKSMHNAFTQEVEAFVLPHIIADQPAHQLNSASLQIPSNIALADPNFDKPGKIDMLIGAEHYYSLLLPNQSILKTGGPVLQNTKLGWIIAGRISSDHDSAAVCAAAATDEEVDRLLERFWTLENLETEERHRSPIEAHCEMHFVGNLGVAKDGKFVVKLPFSEQSSALGASQKTATNRFLALERRTSPEVWKGHVDFMNEYEALGHMKQVHQTDIPANHYFIPHHCVLKPKSSTTKLRVVFDASCKTTSNKSLNDILYAGPTVQSELFAILLRFRTHKYVFTADIEKMYRQVWIHPDDQYHQLIFWRRNLSDDLKYYRLKTVTYGTTSAPFLATKCLDYLSEKAKDQFPLGSSALKHDFYVDDCLTGANSVAEAVQIQKELNKILLPSGFKLRKWCSNNGQILTDVPEADTI
nr:uncharacterized protein LOC123002525 [Drosophila takahashii]